MVWPYTQQWYGHLLHISIKPRFYLILSFFIFRRMENMVQGLLIISSSVFTSQGIWYTREAYTHDSLITWLIDSLIYAAISCLCIPWICLLTLNFIYSIFHQVIKEPWCYLWYPKSVNFLSAWSIKKGTVNVEYVIVDAMTPLQCKACWRTSNIQIWTDWRLDFYKQK